MNNQDKSTFIYLDQDAASITEELKIEISERQIDKIDSQGGRAKAIQDFASLTNRRFVRSPHTGGDPYGDRVTNQRFVSKQNQPLSPSPTGTGLQIGLQI